MLLQNDLVMVLHQQQFVKFLQNQVEMVQGKRVDDNCHCREHVQLGVVKNHIHEVQHTH